MILHIPAVEVLGEVPRVGFGSDPKSWPRSTRSPGHIGQKSWRSRQLYACEDSPDIFGRPDTWSMSGGGHWSQKEFPESRNISQLFQELLKKPRLKKLPCSGCTLLCSDAALFPSVWCGRRCGIDAGNIFFKIRFKKNKCEYLPHGECVVAVAKWENCFNITRRQSFGHL